MSSRSCKQLFFQLFASTIHSNCLKISIYSPQPLHYNVFTVEQSRSAAAEESGE